MRNQIFHSPGNEEAELAKIPGDGDPPPPHWDLYLPCICLAINKPQTVIDVRIATLQIMQSKGLKFL